MGRAILAAVVGYFLMAFIAVGGAGLTWMIVGAEGAFRPGETVASTSWSALSCVFGLVAAIIGGFVASVIDRSQTRLATKILVGIVLVLGLVTFGITMSVTPLPFPEGTNVADLGFVEAGQYASSPAWYNFVIPIVGIIGVLIGSRLLKPKPVEMLIAGNSNQTTDQV